MFFPQHSEFTRSFGISLLGHSKRFVHIRVCEDDFVAFSKACTEIPSVRAPFAAE